MKTLISLHIPKTGGQTFYRVLESIYAGKNNHFFSGRIRDELVYRNKNEWDRTHSDLLYGHVTFGIHTAIPIESTYIAIFREPISRLMSHYYYLPEHPEHHFYRPVVKKNLSLAEFCRYPSWEIDNVQIRWLIDGGRDIPFGGITREHLNQAIDNINYFCSAVGISDEWDKSLRLFQKVLGWPGVPQVDSVNVTKKRLYPHELTDNETIAALNERNNFDIELYSYVVEKFYEDCERLKI